MTEDRLASWRPISTTRSRSRTWRRKPARWTSWSTTRVVPGSDPLPTSTSPRFDALFSANVRSTYLLTATIAPAMAARGHGSIVNLDSMAGSVGLAGGAAYSANQGVDVGDDARLGRGSSARPESASMLFNPARSTPTAPRPN